MLHFLHFLNPPCPLSICRPPLCFPSPASGSQSLRLLVLSLKDPSSDRSNSPPIKTIKLEGCDFEHQFVLMKKLEGDPTRDEIIDSYIKTLAMVVGSEEEARMKIYSVYTRHHFGFGALVSDKLAIKLLVLPRVVRVWPDLSVDVRNKTCGGEPFIDGKAVPYDPKYYELWRRG